MALVIKLDTHTLSPSLCLSSDTCVRDIDSLIHSFIVYMKPTQITATALQCKTTLWSSVHWQLQN